jgi:hypothetical protein
VCRFVVENLWKPGRCLWKACGRRQVVHAILRAWLPTGNRPATEMCTSGHLQAKTPPAGIEFVAKQGA